MSAVPKLIAKLILCVAIGTVSFGQGLHKLSPKEIFQKYNDSVVTIETDIKTGSGFFVKNGLLVVTCYHVIRDAKSIQVKGTKGASWEVGFIYFDVESDTAILKLADDSKRTPIPVGDFSKLETGDDLCVIGNPLGFLDQSLTTGIVSARRQSGNVELIQTTAPISPGSSGSPVINSVGQFVGFIDYNFTGGQALNMAVSSSSVARSWAEDRVPVAAFFASNMAFVQPPRVLKTRASSSQLSHIGIELISIPPGIFSMGSIETEQEKPIHQVFLDSYRISKNDITVAQYRAYCESEAIDFDRIPKPDWGWIDDHPMVNITWYEARDFCRWAGGDLPTEAQWERAARGTDRRRYPWGNDFVANKLWCSEVSATAAIHSTMPVGALTDSASPCGCLDMAGNAWQWCLDWYDEHGYSHQLSQRNPKGSIIGEERVLRGGSWYCTGVERVRSGYREHYWPSEIDDDLGFRLAIHP